MIQRIQTVWLLLAAIASFLLTRIPLFVGKATGMPDRYYLATESLPLFILAVVPGIIAVVSIFLFKNRKRQLRLSIMGIFTSLPFLFWEMQKISDFVKVNNLTTATYYWGAILPLVVFTFFVFAIRNIRKDEKLIKSLDRLR